VKPLIIPIFVIYKGCPHRCLYCNERITAGAYPDSITEEHVRHTVDGHLKTAAPGRDRREIAFYGGNFTGMDPDYQRKLLRLARSYVEDGLVQSIRISTRPDYIDEARTELLRNYGVTTVEIGAQSMVDDVLRRSQRGHTADDVRRSVRLLKESGFETGIHLMAGLPGDTRRGFMYTIEETVKMKPHTVRIHPTLVLKDTELEEIFLRGTYRPLSLDEAVRLCRDACIRLRSADISVIRLGLHISEEMGTEGSVVAGPIHPAFGTLVEASLFLRMASQLLDEAHRPEGPITFSVSSRDVSCIRGLRNSNLSILRDRFCLPDIRIVQDPLQARETLILTVPGKTYTTDVKSCSLEA